MPKSITVTLSKDMILADKYLDWSQMLLKTAERIEAKRHQEGDTEFVCERPRRMSQLAAAKAKLLLS